ncbi:uncharacterized protein LY79DRAFT_585279 [Colletotrichum navitas]|uniref:Uncharacterized protein n=1 Tax=Colletotrichum navitas TaxID=681940 RepID=A0AAD8UY49_9PEZI|nr:uncharacterized protein LY79DRAFT_585279 [Colletotrichum navitas]KAK1564161.1 hypothetical protein LY79DRAFT_585279 [Colletotrichum navitas]
MHSIYPLLVLLWSLSCTFADPAPPVFTPPPKPSGLISPGSGPGLRSLSYTFADPAQPGFTPPPKPAGLNSPGSGSGLKPLRQAKDIYTVAVKGDKYLVYTPYFEGNTVPVTVLIFPTDKPDQIIIPLAFNGGEKPHTDRSPRLHLSDIIQAVASKHARKSLSSIDWVIIKTVVNKKTEAVLISYYEDWKKHQANPKAQLPKRITVDQSDKFWPTFKNTPFFKAVDYTFKPSKKAVVSMDVGPKSGADLWLRLGPLK